MSAKFPRGGGSKPILSHPSTSKPTITVEPTMIERSAMSIMVVKTVIKEIVQIHNGARREEEGGGGGG